MATHRSHLHFTTTTANQINNTFKDHHQHVGRDRRVRNDQYHPAELQHGGAQGRQGGGLLQLRNHEQPQAQGQVPQGDQERDEAGQDMALRLGDGNREQEEDPTGVGGDDADGPHVGSQGPADELVRAVHQRDYPRHLPRRQHPVVRPHLGGARVGQDHAYGVKDPYRVRQGALGGPDQPQPRQALQKTWESNFWNGVVKSSGSSNYNAGFHEAFSKNKSTARYPLIVPEGGVVQPGAQG